MSWTKFRKLACYLFNLTIWILFYFVNSLVWPVFTIDNRRLPRSADHQNNVVRTKTAVFCGIPIGAPNFPSPYLPVSLVFQELLHTSPIFCIIFAHICHTIDHYSADLKLGELRVNCVCWWPRGNGASSMFGSDDVTRKMAGVDKSAEMSDHNSDEKNYLQINTMMNHGYFTSNRHDFLCCIHLSQFSFLFRSPLKDILRIQHNYCTRILSCPMMIPQSLFDVRSASLSCL